MALSVNWSTLVVFVPQADLIPLGGTDYRLDLEAFRNNLHTLQYSEDGMAFLDIFRRKEPTTLAGIVYAQIIEIINGYTVEFEDGLYSVNIDGNSNLAEASVAVLNQVSLRPQNSAGAVVTAGGGGAAASFHKWGS